MAPMRARAALAAAVAAGGLVAPLRAQRRLRIVNGCPNEPLWIAHLAGPASGPDPQNIRIDPLQSHDFLTPDNLEATRYWPKTGCDASGRNCAVGDSGGPGQPCAHCAPPIDTKFEATWGKNGNDWVDLSLVDGYTLPVKLEVQGGQCRDSRGGGLMQQIDCSGLSVDACPAQEPLSAAGMTVDLRATNPVTGSVSGCYSPCTRLTDDKWVRGEPHRSPGTPGVAPYCCPPPMTPEQCRAGPIVQTRFVNTLHSRCHGAYAYSYDDAMGLYICQSSARYTVTYYCLSGSQPPGPPQPPPQPTPQPTPGAGYEYSGPNMDLGGPTLKQLGGASSQCGGFCDQHGPGCGGWAFFQGVCYLKPPGQNFYPHEGRIAAKKRAPSPSSHCGGRYQQSAPGMDLGGAVLDTPRVGQEPQCCEKCDAHPGCGGYTFFEGVCYLKPHGQGFYPNPGRIAAKRVVGRGLAAQAAASATAASPGFGDANRSAHVALADASAGFVVYP